MNTLKLVLCDDLVLHLVCQMQRVGGTQGGSQRPFSILDRLLLTHPVWLQLSLNKDSALYILLREPVGVRASQSNRSITFHVMYLNILEKCFVTVR